MNNAQIGLLTGPVGVGKTTVAGRVVGLARRGGLVCGGLLAPALLNDRGQKAGIWGVDILSGRRRVLARIDQDLGGPAVGHYSFDAASLAWALAVVGKAIGACDLLVVDEIGKLELWCDGGLAPIVRRLASGEVERALVLVRDSLLPELRARLTPIECVLFQVTAENRTSIPPDIVQSLFGITAARS